MFGTVTWAGLDVQARNVQAPVGTPESQRAAIAKTGSRHARRLLVESAWHYAGPPRLGVTPYGRQEGQPAHVLQIARRARCRLPRLSQRSRGVGKPADVLTVAVARKRPAFPGPSPRSEASGRRPR